MAESFSSGAVLQFEQLQVRKKIERKERLVCRR